jgi:glycine oxidase
LAQSFGGHCPALRRIVPIKGQALAVTRDYGTVGEGRVVRGEGVYVVPREANRVVIGATSESGVADVAAPMPVALDLLDRARRICRGLDDVEIAGTWAGVRPGSPDHLPFVGALEPDGLFVNVGHERNGILLAPLSAKIICDLILKTRDYLSPNPFNPDRPLSPETLS